MTTSLISKLKAFETYAHDVGKRIARIDYVTFCNLNISTGDIIEIKGKKSTVARAFPLYPSDEKKKMIRMDELIRKNAEIQMADTVTIKPANFAPAKKIFYRSSPLNKYRKKSPPFEKEFLTNALEDLPLMKGDHVSVHYYHDRYYIEIVETDSSEEIVLPSTETEFILLDES